MAAGRAWLVVATLLTALGAAACIAPTIGSPVPDSNNVRSVAEAPSATTSAGPAPVPTDLSVESTVSLAPSTVAGTAESTTNSAGPADTATAVDCSDNVCVVHGAGGLPGGRIAVVGTDTGLTVTWTMDGSAPMQEAVPLQLGETVLTECVPLQVSVVCLVNTVRSPGHVSATLFSVDADGVVPIDSMDSLGMPGLWPLERDRLLLVSWTSSAVLGHPEPHAQAWQTWVVSADSIRLTGCGLQRSDGKAAEPYPEQPLTGSCPDNVKPSG